MASCKDSIGWMFSKLDTNGDLYLDQAELAAINLDKYEVCIRPFFNSCDSYKDGKVSTAEWCLCFWRESEYHREGGNLVGGAHAYSFLRPIRTRFPRCMQTTQQSSQRPSGVDTSGSSVFSPLPRWPVTVTTRSYEHLSRLLTTRLFYSSHRSGLSVKQASRNWVCRTTLN